MAVVLPFAAVRPSHDICAEVAALPYDVYSRAEAAQYVKGRAHTFLRIDRPETSFAPDFDMYSDECYRKAKEIYTAEKAAGVYVRDVKSGYYIYELTMNGRSQTGICALSSVNDYLTGVCRKHENTVEEKEMDRIRHIDTLSAQTGPIFLCYRANAAISAIVNAKKEDKALEDITFEDGVRHRIWVIDEEETVEKLQSLFASVPATYIADGHHRAASAVKVALKRRREHPDFTGKEEFNAFLSVLFPDDELKIMDYNRVVSDLNGLTSEAFLQKLSGLFEVQAISGKAKPESKGEVTMNLQGTWYQLKLKKEIAAKYAGDPVNSLDVAVLQNEVLAPILGIADPRRDKRIRFVGGIRGTKELARLVDEGAAVAFALYPTDIGELLEVADAGLLMPPKSTWFEPKLRSGFFIHEF